MKNIEKYEDQIKAELEKDNTLGCVVNKLMGNKCDYYPKCNDCYLKVLDWLLQEYKGPILTDEEKVIIKNIIKAFEPFDDEIERISKHLTANDDEYYLVFDCKYSGFNSPIFTDSELFENMELVKDYTLKDLGL